MKKLILTTVIFMIFISATARSLPAYEANIRCGDTLYCHPQEENPEKTICEMQGGNPDWFLEVSGFSKDIPAGIYRLDHVTLSGVLYCRYAMASPVKAVPAILLHGSSAHSYAPMNPKSWMATAWGDYACIDRLSKCWVSGNW